MNWKRACRQTSKVVKMVRGKRVFATGVYFIWHFKNFQQWKIKLPRIRLTAADRGRRWWNSGLGRWLFSGARWRPPVWSSLPGTSALALWSHRRAGCWNHKGFSLTGGLGRSICILALLVLQSSFAWWIGVCPLAPMTKCSLVGGGAGRPHMPAGNPQMLVHGGDSRSSICALPKQQAGPGEVDPANSLSLSF